MGHPRVIVALILSLGLVGCREPQLRAHAQCEVEFIKVFPNEERQLINRSDGFMQSCMAAKGYAFHVEPDRCLASQNFAHNADCYLPKGRFSEIAYFIAAGEFHHARHRLPFYSPPPEAGPEEP